MLHSKHIRWCWNNGVFFVPVAINQLNRLVVIGKYFNNQLTKGKTLYNQKNEKEQKQLYKKIDELYKTVFKKNN